MLDLKRIPLHRLKQMVCDMNLPEPKGNKTRRITYQNLLEEVLSKKFVIYFS